MMNSSGSMTTPERNTFQKNPGLTSRLFERRDIDEPDDLDVSWSEQFKGMEALTQGASEKEITTLLQNRVAESMDKHTEITTALLYGILTNPDLSRTYVRYLNFIVRDAFTCCVSLLKRITMEKFHKMLEEPRNQTLWFIKELVKLNIRDTEVLCINLLRQIIGGDISAKNLKLAHDLLDLFVEHKNWLYSKAELIPFVVFTYVRLISDHAKQPRCIGLKEREVPFICELLREKFEECRVIGRDLVRLLQDVSKIPEFENLWRDLLNRPSSFSTYFAGIPQLLGLRTPRKYLQSRITFEMENFLTFILKQVKIGNQKRYQIWFHTKWLTTPESESLVCDLIRYICGVHHPPNHVLCSDIVPRWAIIGWLLKCTKTNFMAANAKLALFYDWLFFDPAADNIMNIEPAMLLMLHSIPKYAAITATLIEFLILIIDGYDIAHKDMLRRGVNNSFRTLIEKGVVANLFPLYTCPLLDPALIAKLKNAFPQFCPAIKENTSLNPSIGYNGDPPPMINVTPHEDSKSSHHLQTTSPPHLGSSAVSTNAVSSESSHTSIIEEHSLEEELPEENLNSDRNRHNDDKEEIQEENDPPFIESVKSSYEPQEQSTDTHERENEGSKMSTEAHEETIEDASSLLRRNFGLSLLNQFSEAVETQNLSVARSSLIGILTRYIEMTKDNTQPLCNIMADSTLSFRERQEKLFQVKEQMDSKKPKLFDKNHNIGIELAKFLAQQLKQDYCTDVSSSLPNDTSEYSSLQLLFAIASKSRKVVTETGEQISSDQVCHCMANLLSQMHLIEESTGFRFICFLIEQRFMKIEKLTRKKQKNKNVVDEEFEHLLYRSINWPGSYLINLLYPSNEDTTVNHSATQSTSSSSGTHTATHLRRKKKRKTTEHNKNEDDEQSKKDSEENDGDSKRNKDDAQDIDQYDEQWLLPYLFFVAALDPSNATQFINDFKQYSQSNMERFFTIVPLICRQLSFLSCGNVDYIYLLVSIADPQQLYRLVCQLQLGNFHLFGSKAVTVIEHSLEWETFEQYCLWQLLNAEFSSETQFSSRVEPQLHTILSLVDPTSHQEALSGLRDMLKAMPPSSTVVEAVLTLPISFGLFPSCLLHFWTTANSYMICCSMTSCLQSLVNARKYDQLVNCLKHLAVWRTSSFKSPLSNVESDLGLNKRPNSEDKKSENEKYFSRISVEGGQAFEQSRRDFAQLLKSVLDELRSHSPALISAIRSILLNPPSDPTTTIWWSCLAGDHFEPQVSLSMLPTVGKTTENKEDLNNNNKAQPPKRKRLKQKRAELSDD